MSSALKRGRILDKQASEEAHITIQNRIQELKDKRDNHTLNFKERKELLRIAGWEEHRDQT